MKKLFVITGFLIALGTAQAEVAETNTPRIDLRQHKQHQRIMQGLESGKLTRPEARRLAAQQHRIERFEEIAKLDGVMTKGERARLTHQQNMASRNIFRQKHNMRNFR